MDRSAAGALVRALRGDDVAAVQAVERAAGERFRSFPEPRIAACADHDPMPTADLLELVDEGRAWVVEVDGRVVGFLAVRVVDGACHVEEVSVHPDHGARGYATLLLDRATAWAEAHRLPAVTLTTFRDVPWNRRFYERRGFRVVPGDELSEPLHALVLHEEEAFGLPRELRVVMRRP